MKTVKYLTIAFAALVLASCSSSRITSSWKADQENGTVQTTQHFNKIVVVGLFENESRALRTQMEEQLVKDLKEEGFNAVSSFSLYGPKSFENMKEEDVLKELKKNGVEGVITIGLVDKNKSRHFVYGSRYGGSFYNPYRPWGGYYYNPYRGHYETSTNFVFETNLYDVAEKKLIYSVQSQSFSPSSINSMADGYSRSIIKDLRKNNVLG